MYSIMKSNSSVSTPKKTFQFSKLKIWTQLLHEEVKAKVSNTVSNGWDIKIPKIHGKKLQIF